MSEQGASTGKEKRSWSRWWWPVLIASVALNLLVIGAIAGFWARHRGPPDGVRGNSLVSYARTLPKDRRRELRPLLKNFRQTLKPLRADARHARRAARQALMADPYDAKSYRAAVARRLKAVVTLRESANDIFARLGAELTLAERREFIEWRRHRRFKRWRQRRFRRWRDHSRQPPAAQ